MFFLPKLLNASYDNILPVTSYYNKLPITSNHNILPITSNYKILPITSKNKILPLLVIGIVSFKNGMQLDSVDFTKNKISHTRIIYKSVSSSVQWNSLQKIKCLHTKNLKNRQGILKRV